ncbi:dipeptidase [Salibacterium aidingense]|uniref:dipeptidase n=1 Tax=Salibacterium aidingense TaxID=384933 RepID=UPI00041FE99D|nr:membrane dipeptidase [Salibacterium aidingense]
MDIADAHCDALWKMVQSLPPSVTAEAMNKGGVRMQNFALFVPTDKTPGQQKELLKKEMQLYHHWRKSSLGDGGIQPLLSLEGAGVLEDDFNEWERMIENGVEMASLTWNERNELAAGSLQSNNYGLTDKGKNVIQWMNDHNIVFDAAHLNEKSFWQAVELVEQPVVSHTNVKTLHPHPRNLSDDQIRTLVQKQGFIGLTFYPPFINGTETAGFSDFGRQVEHLCSLGAADIIGFGSDFDGITETITGMETPAKFPSLIEWLLQRFDEEIVKKIACCNFRRYWNNKRYDTKRHPFQTQDDPLE